MVYLKGWRYGLFAGGLVFVLGAAMYAVAIYPITHVDEYKEIQKKNRANINIEDVQPGGMRVWSDPFSRK